MEQFETEVKFYLTDIADVRSSILKLGAVCKGRSFETNIRFEDKDNNLIQKNSLLRLRKYDLWDAPQFISLYYQEVKYCVLGTPSTN